MYVIIYIHTIYTHKLMQSINWTLPTAGEKPNSLEYSSKTQAISRPPVFTSGAINTHTHVYIYSYGKISKFI